MTKYDPPDESLGPEALEMYNQGYEDGQAQTEDQISYLVNQAKSSTGYSGAPVGYVSAQSIPLLLEAILLKLTQNPRLPGQCRGSCAGRASLASPSVGYTERECASCHLPITTGQPYVSGPLNAMGYYPCYHADCTDD